VRKLRETHAPRITVGLTYTEYEPLIAVHYIFLFYTYQVIRYFGETAVKLPSAAFLAKLSSHVVAKFMSL
jgi:hypothetical protein